MCGLAFHHFLSSSVKKNNHNVKKQPGPAPAMSRTIRDIWPFSDSNFDDDKKIICE